VAGALETAAPHVVVRELAVVHDREVGEGVGPVGVRARDVDVGLGRHADVADPVGPAEVVEPVALGDGFGVPEVLHDLERAADRQDLDAVDLLDRRGHRLLVALVADDEAQRVGGDVFHRAHLNIVLCEHALDPLDPLADALLDAAPARDVLVLGHLQPHHEVARMRRAVDREAGRIRPPVLQRPEHPRHLAADIRRASPVDDPCNPAHGRAPQGR
jgi:hypothetical protein